jgi:hypothetical protein
MHIVTPIKFVHFFTFPLARNVVKDFHIGHRHKPLANHLLQHRQRAANLFFGVNRYESMTYGVSDSVRQNFFCRIFSLVNAVRKLELDR